MLLHKIYIKCFKFHCCNSYGASDSSENPQKSTAPARNTVDSAAMGKRAATSEPNNNETATHISPPDANRRRDGSNIIYGWRKQCLFGIIFLLMVLISVNLALTLWILKVMEISSVSAGYSIHFEHNLNIHPTGRNWSIKSHRRWCSARRPGNHPR